MRATVLYADAAIFLVTSLAVKGKVQGKGATQTTQHINIVEFFQNSILPDLQIPDVNQSSVLKAGNNRVNLAICQMRR